MPLKGDQQQPVFSGNGGGESGPLAAVDNLAATDMLEIKMNPITQKSLVINHSAYTNQKLDASSSSSSFERESSLDSDRTSIMDSQYRPHVQLKFAFVSWLVYVVLCSLAASLTLVAASTAPDPFLQRLFSFLFSVVALVYSLMQLVFYVISRDDVCHGTTTQAEAETVDGGGGGLLVTCWPHHQRRRNEHVPLDDDQPLDSDRASPSASEHDECIPIDQVDNWYFEPKVIVPQAFLRYSLYFR